MSQWRAFSDPIPILAGVTLYFSFRTGTLDVVISFASSSAFSRNEERD